MQSTRGADNYLRPMLSQYSQLLLFWHSSNDAANSQLVLHSYSFIQAGKGQSYVSFDLLRQLTGGR